MQKKSNIIQPKFSKNCVNPLTFLFCGFIFNITSTPDVALGTSVLYLIPGIPYINSVSDLIHGHLLCFMSRFINACVITTCLGIGLSLGILLMNIQYF